MNEENTGNENEIIGTDCATCIKMDGNLNFRITKIEIVGDIYDDSGAKCGNGNNAVCLDSEEYASLKISDTSAIVTALKG